jgi:putative selenium metabolism hydrolase
METIMPKHDVIAFTQALIRLPSESGDEGPVVDRVLEEMRVLGFDEVWRDATGNAVGIINGAHPGPTILLDAHCDTVGIAPGVPWQHEPFGGTIEGDLLFGRGAMDMKGALAAMVFGAAAVERAHLAGRVAVTASVMEENLEGAALKPVVESVGAAYVVIGEATDLNLARGGRGRAEIHLETVGRPAHSSTPHLGRNAVHDMRRVIEIVEGLPLPAPDPLLGPGVLALTDIISEPYPGYSVIPSRCRVTYDRRLLAGEREADLLDALTGAVAAAVSAQPALAGLELHATIAQGEHHTYTGAILRGAKFLPAWLLPESDPFVQAAYRGLQSAGLHPRFGAYGFCTNAAYSAGQAGIPTVGFGPGREEHAHIIDERVSVSALRAAARGYQGIVEAMLAG